MPGLDSTIRNRLHEVLPLCSAFQSDQNLRAIFVDERIYEWRTTVPEAGSVYDRVSLTIDFLLERKNLAGENALVLFITNCADRVDPGKMLHHQLNKLAADL